MRDVLKVSIGERIQQFRKARGLSQEQLAESLNVSRQAISKWETDQSAPEIENLLALSRVFSVSTDELLGNDAVRNTEISTAQLGRIKPRFGYTQRVKNWFAYIDRRMSFILFTLLCFIAVGVCIIVNYAIDRQITWAAYPIISVPAAIVGIVFVWIVYLLFRYLKISMWYKFAISVFLIGVIANRIINHYVDTFLNSETTFLQNFIELFDSVIIATLLGVMGYIENKKKIVDIEKSREYDIKERNELQEFMNKCIAELK